METFFKAQSLMDITNYPTKLLQVSFGPTGNA